MRSPLGILFSLASVMFVIACGDESDPDAMPSEERIRGSADDSVEKGVQSTQEGESSSQPKSDSNSNPSLPLPACAIDGVTWRGGEYQVVAKGRIWSIDRKGALIGSAVGEDLRSLPGMKSGPCAGQGSTCRIDAFSWIPENSEYWVLYGSKTWVLDAKGAYKGVSANDASPSMKTGPCAGQNAGACLVQAIAWGGGNLFVINNAKYWKLNGQLHLEGSTAGSALPGELCNALGGTCTIDDLTWRDDLNEFHVIAGGRAWFMDSNGKLLADSGNDLRKFSGFAQGPCAP